MKSIKKIIKRTPIIGIIVKRIVKKLRQVTFSGSQEYWEARYRRGGTSGDGSYGKLAEFKAEVVNLFVKDHEIHSVLEFGCGDGNQIALANYPAYIGLDVSKTSIKLCEGRFKKDDTKKFSLYEPNNFDHTRFKSELTLSLDVIYHLVEDNVFETYMKHLFSTAEKFVIIYSSDTDVNSFESPHIKHRRFSKWVKENFPEWKLIQKIPNKYPFTGDTINESWADFFIYEKI